MAYRIERIERVAYTSTKIEPVRGYTPAERSAKLRQIEEDVAVRAEIRAYLSKYPNPNHLSFAELLEHAINEHTTKDEQLY